MLCHRIFRSDSIVCFFNILVNLYVVLSKIFVAVCQEELRASLMDDRPIFEVEPTIPINPDDFIDSNTAQFDANDMIEIRAQNVAFDLLNLKYVSTVNTQVQITFTNSPQIVATVSY